MTTAKNFNIPAIVGSLIAFTLLIAFIKKRNINEAIKLFHWIYEAYNFSMTEQEKLYENNDFFAGSSEVFLEHATKIDEHNLKLFQNYYPESYPNNIFKTEAYSIYCQINKHIISDLLKIILKEQQSELKKNQKTNYNSPYNRLNIQFKNFLKRNDLTEEASKRLSPYLDNHQLIQHPIGVYLLKMNTADNSYSLEVQYYEITTLQKHIKETNHPPFPLSPLFFYKINKQKVPFTLADKTIPIRPGYLFHAVHYYDNFEKTLQACQVIKKDLFKKASNTAGRQPYQATEQDARHIVSKRHMA